MSMSGSHYEQFIDFVFSGRKPFESVRANFLEKTNGQLATVAMEHYVRYARAHHRPASEVDPSKSAGYLPYDPRAWQVHKIEDAKVSHLIWHRTPDSWREQTYSVAFPTSYFVSRGVHRWIYEPPLNPEYTAHNSGANRIYPYCAPLLEPSMLDQHLEVDLRVIAESRIMGRDAIEIQAPVESWDYPPLGFFFKDGSHEYRLLADKETGVLLRFAALNNDREFFSITAQTIEFNVSIPDEIFNFQLPSQRDRS